MEKSNINYETDDKNNQESQYNLISWPQHSNGEVPISPSGTSMKNLSGKFHMIRFISYIVEQYPPYAKSVENNSETQSKLTADATIKRLPIGKR